MKTRFQHRIIDTSFLTDLFQPVSRTRPLEILCEECGIDVKDRHHALGDAIMTGHLWAHYLQLAMDAGYRNLGDVYSEIAKRR